MSDESAENGKLKGKLAEARKAAASRPDGRDAVLLGLLGEEIDQLLAALEVAEAVAWIDGERAIVSRVGKFWTVDGVDNENEHQSGKAVSLVEAVSALRRKVEEG